MGDKEDITSSEKVLILPLSEDSKRITQILSNEKAMKMLELLADKPMSSSDVAEELELPLTTVKYNIDGLIEADLVKIKETKWSRKGREVKIYEPVQKLIVVAPGSMKNDRSSIISMLKKYLGLVTGAVFAAAGLEGIIRRINTDQPMAEDFAAPMYAEDTPVSAMKEDIPQPGHGDELRTRTDNITEEGTSNIEPDAFNTSDMGTYPVIDDKGTPLWEDLNNIEHQKDIMDASHMAPESVNGANGILAEMLQHDILSHFSVWFFFGCLFIIALVFLREMYNRGKNI